jgi:hypothetical protein
MEFSDGWDSGQLSGVSRQRRAVGYGVQSSGISRQMTGLHMNHSSDERTAEIGGDAVQE